ncbi:hypothetical protein ONR75_24230 [Rhodopseudomonas sp. P2A-2r]|uniref:hypothetical protein n=1 Tax=Rhodopseudomonas sp. P2A-2r TaxID=2991972 RepID=UPI00223446F2|nr:hypothetical protein [Rhodopseudomonas sp. P2A-2r]UZE47948.1 hypothetical protein ONR75_24230 [Rhodopseudomonas sp. P2A-2r]
MSIETSDPINTAIHAMLDRMVRTDAAERDKVRAEIRQHGTWWAAAEILRLRRDVARIRAELRKVT